MGNPGDPARGSATKPNRGRGEGSAASQSAALFNEPMRPPSPAPATAGPALPPPVTPPASPPDSPQCVSRWQMPWQLDETTGPPPLDLPPALTQHNATGEVAETQTSVLLFIEQSMTLVEQARAACHNTYAVRV